MNKFKSKLAKFTDFISRCLKTYVEWLHKKRIQRRAKLTKRQFSLQCKVKKLDEKLVNYIKKNQAKKKKCQEKLDRVNRKLDKFDKVQQVEVVTKKSRGKNYKISLPSSNV